MIPLTILANDDTSRVRRDRLELLTALITAPSFDPLYREAVINVPPQHPVYAWQCSIDGCQRSRRMGHSICGSHNDLWNQAQTTGTTKAHFLRTAQPLPAARGTEHGPCRICPERPATTAALRLCAQHYSRWLQHAGTAHQPAEERLRDWMRTQTPMAGFGTCQAACPFLAASSLGLCRQHESRYQSQGRPGGAEVATGASARAQASRQRPVSYQDEADFRTWCAQALPVTQPGLINLYGLPPLLAAEIQWGLNAHAQLKQHSIWDLNGIKNLVNHCWLGRFTSLTDLDAEGYPGLTRRQLDSMVRQICWETVNGLRCIYYSPPDTKDAGFLETDHFGRRFKNAQSHFDISAVPQRWLRDLLWEHLAEWLRSPHCPRTRGPFDNMRRAAVELGTFLQAEAPAAGHDPAQLRQEHAQRFVADQNHRARHSLPSLSMVRVDGTPSTVTDITRQWVLNSARKLLYSALTTGQSEQLGLDRGFIVAMPNGGAGLKKRSRNPFTDEAARALSHPDNLERFARDFDPNDNGLRDVWETIVYTGRRCSEVTSLRLDCIGRYRTLPMLWHDQTKVGNYNEAVRIPEPLYERLDQRRTKTLTRFEHRHGRTPTTAERTAMALFPSLIRNPNGQQPISYGHFNSRFKAWIDSLDLGGAYVAHQARHTLATNLLRAGASLTHIRRYLGQVSDRMAEHYIKITNDDLEDILHTVWVAGPGAPHPGELISGTTTPLTRAEATALALDLSLRSTPAHGGFCTYQPVVNGDTCPWNLDCENCDKFVLSGADLLYWRRKAEQWRSIAENAPDDATADYLHSVFEPTARAIDGLERALAGLGLLNEALAMDLRRPQDYFHSIWSTAFRARDLAAIQDPPAPAQPTARQP